MPNPKDYKTEDDWMAACVPIRKKEGDKQDQAVAVCMSMWRDKDNAPVSEARGEGQGVGGEPQGDGGVDTCVCPGCGYETEHERGTPCAEQTCPECGAKVAPAEDARPTESDEPPESALAEAGRRLNAKQVSELRVAQATIEALLRWADYDDAEEPETEAESAIAESANIADYLDSSIHREFTIQADTLLGKGILNRDERIALSGFIGKALALFAELVDAEFPHLRTQVLALDTWGTPLYLSGNAEPAEVSEAAFAESSVGHVLSLAESAIPPTERVVPLHLDVALIQPGWGNARDNHYYNSDVLRRDASVFKGVKMYESDHRAAEKSTRTWVSTVTDIVGFTDDGAPIARVSVHNKDFAERLLALNADKLLDKMECSILASGKARKGKVDGRQGHIVESITAAESVDWVTRAGAGGRALSLSESQEGTMPETETQEPIQETTFQEEAPDPTPLPLPAERARELVEATNLPEAARTRLLAAEYAEEASLQEAIQAEVTYIKELTRSGQPFAQGRSSTQNEPVTEETRVARFNEIMRQIGAQEV